MYELKVQKSFGLNIKMTERVCKLIRMFGLRAGRLKERIEHRCELTVRPGEIIYITGASGAGKSVLLNGLYEQSHKSDRLRLSEIVIENNQSLIDCIEGPIPKSLEVLSKAGLSDVFCMLQTPSRLSEGQQWRYRLARAIMSEASIIFVDEFTSTLDRITAAVVSFHLRKAATQSGKIFILASCHEDILPDLKPDVLLIKYLNGQMHTVRKDKICA